ncbi:MAG: AI-2E family transporter [Anaerolineae bacterium]|nr:AI-2E family transporter [Anaerolineae bacterium]
MKELFAEAVIVRFMVIATGCVAIVAGMHAIASILNPIFVAILVAVVLDIPRSLLIRRGMSSGAALGVTILGTLVVALFLVFFVGNTAINFRASFQANQEQFQAQLQEMGETLSRFGIEADDIQASTQSDQTNLFGLVRYAVSGVVNLLSSAFFILVYAIFILIEVSVFPAKLNEAFKPSEPAYRYLDTVTKNLRSFLVATTQVALITGIGVGIGLWLLGVKFALLWGFVAFLMNYVPYIGSILAAIPAVIMAFIQFGPSTTLLLVIGMYLLVNIIVNNTIYPRMMSQGTDLSMFVVLASMLFWGWVLGPIGLILSVPITAVIKISLESYAGSRWLAVMLGAGPSTETQSKDVPAA